jgi:hypothetical protein
VDRSHLRGNLGVGIFCSELTLRSGQWTAVGFKPVGLKWTVYSEQWTVWEFAWLRHGGGYPSDRLGRMRDRLRLKSGQCFFCVLRTWFLDGFRLALLRALRACCVGGFGVGIFVILGRVGRGCFCNRLMVR